MALVYTPECPQHAAETPTSYEEFLSVLSNLTLGGPSLLIDCDRGRVHRHHTAVDLSRQEYELLAYLAVNADQTISRDELVATVWAHRELGSDSRTVDITIRRLRAKLDGADLISTVRGQGYRFNSSPTVAVRAVAVERSRHALAA